MEKLTFVTGSDDKFREASGILKRELERVELDLPEIQEIEIEEVARRKAEDAFEMLGRPLFVEDAGLSIKALKGFPGALQAWVAKTIGNEGLLKLLEGERREAKAVACVAFHDGGEVRLFTGEVEGEISEEVREGYGWDYDFVFVPKGCDKTFSEMGMEKKNSISHRRKALEKFAEHLEGLA